MKAKKQEKDKSLRLAIYFGLLIIFIILVSVVFKAIDIVRKSRFDGRNRFTVAIIDKTKASLISVSPSDGALTELSVDGANSLTELNQLSLPFDAYIQTNLNNNSNPKSYFLKTLFNVREIRTNLTLVDLLRLGIFSGSVNADKIDSEHSSTNDAKLSIFASTLFIDPVMRDEKISLQITNSTDVPGLGNKLAKYLTNIGGDVVLVNSSSNAQEKSQIFYGQESYTLKKISKMLNITPQKKESKSISDIIIIIGKDRGSLLN